MKIFGRFARARAGSAAIEFAFVAPIFFVLLLGILEAGVLFFAEFSLQSAVNDAGRLVRTGQAQNSSMTATQFRNQICGQVSAIMPCNANLQIDVQSYADFSSASFTSPLNPDGTLKSGLNNYSMGNACSVVLVRAFYKWPVVTPVLDWFLVNMAGNAHLIAAAAAFRNEPYAGAGGC